jgi:nucleoside-diphosphate-sugar epimerase
MNVAILGGTGAVGREAADALERRGRAVQALSRANRVRFAGRLGPGAPFDVVRAAA